jgi:TonB family protein
MRGLLRTSLLLGASVASAFGQVGAAISAEPLLSQPQIEELEAKVQEAPSDWDTRLRLLRGYLALPARRDYQQARLEHILHAIRTRPADPAFTGPLLRVSSEVDPAGHEQVRQAWIESATAHQGDVYVQVNAARALHAEHPMEAEDMLTRWIELNPDRKLAAANLGFLYALDLIGMIEPQSPRLRPVEQREPLMKRAREALNASTNPYVLAGAGTALPNLFMRSEAARTPQPDKAPFEMSSALKAKARGIAPQDQDLAGPMPLIKEFEDFMGQQTGQTVSRGIAPISSSTSPPPASPVMTGSVDVGPPGPRVESAGAAPIRVSGDVQAYKLIQKANAIYPPQAREARIQGWVRFNVIIDESGNVENATVISGHPLLVPSAVQAVQAYRYQPTLLNGKPVKVISQVEIPFALN